MPWTRSGTELRQFLRIFLPTLSFLGVKHFSPLGKILSVESLPLLVSLCKVLKIHMYTNSLSFKVLGL